MFLQQRGFILAITLLFLTLVTLIIVNNVEENLLEIKMSEYFKNKMLVFEAAESGLEIAALKLQGISVKQPNLKPTIKTRIKLLSIHSSGIKRYKIISQDSFHNTRVTLCGFYDRDGLKVQRVWWSTTSC